ncbi:glutamine-synthetase adenylyltransferase [Altericroceibacterium xinjiangense]|uniref:[protein-PII] uridylyltransferase family protein n=1 Tax=Altericroceibacterium xinjiangense TaxID=762261 RepID=UPI001F4A0298|nr:glutamine-synthetase adenylyltransferase [Altericroceibacterium xinjiangense]
MDWEMAIRRAQAHSPFLARGLERFPEIAELLAHGKGEEALAHAHAAGSGAEDIGVALRRQRLALAVALGVGDLAGAFPLARVMTELTEFADFSLGQAIAAAIRERVPDAEPAGFTALALGKQGAGELNYSSDIDPILLYHRDLLPHRAREEPGEAAQRVARRVVELLAHQTGEGHVFRVDLRLRPASEVSPLAISFGAALTHYESSALTWERAAFIRARAAAGDVEAGERFLDMIRPFVWRRSLDFTAIEDIRRLTGRIRDHHEGPREPGPDFDLKRGRGGIREIEFFAQTHQLIHGGRNPALQLRGTRAALDALAAEGIVSADDARDLGQAYDRLRTIEHRLQMVGDRQTHSLPADEAALDNVARLDGLPDGAALVEELRGLTARVASAYDSLLDAPDTEVKTVAAHGFTNRIADWRQSIRTLRSGAARDAFDAISPALAEALAQAPDPERAANRWETLLGRLPSAVNLFRLFEARPGLLDQVLRLLTLAPPLADELGRRPDLLDRLIDASALDLPGSVDELYALMTRGQNSADYERRLDHLRKVVGEERFALGVQLIEARHDVLSIAEGLARVAEAAIRAGAEAAVEEFRQVHGRVPGENLLILGLGRLGGGALTHASDLDVIYLFRGDIGVESDGPRPLTASLYFNRLAQRVTAALSVPTAEGRLYEVDTRLRPQGAQGPIAVNLDSFARYQREDAWTWEHMALNRARPLFGPPAAREELRSIIRDVLDRPRDPEKLRGDVLTMRAEMAAHKHPSGPLDPKLVRGGLVDCEFIVHFLQLRDRIALLPAIDEAIVELAEAQLLPAEFSHWHAVLTRILVAARLLAPDGRVPSEPEQGALARSCGFPDFAALLHGLAEARHGIGRVWADLFGEQLEIEA